MILGIDTGGTHVDAVLVTDGGILGKAKVPNVDDRESVVDVLSSLPEDWSGAAVDRVVVSTTLVVNAAVQGHLPACTNILIPGPGLSPERSAYGDEVVVVPGCVDHRGRVTEPLEYEGSPDTPVVAVCSKFAARNPELENRVRTSLGYDDAHVVLGNESGADLTFPERAATTVANVETKPTFAAYQDDVAAAMDAVGIDAPIYYLKGDGAMLAAHAIRSTPAQTLRSGVAASTLGLLALTDVDDAICVDIGGTTTDVARVAEGFPDVDGATRLGGIEPAYDGVTSESIAAGGDTRIERGPALATRRDGNAAAFGGDAPTLTDALHVTGDFTDGDVAAARESLAAVADGDVADTARRVVDQYVERIAAAIDDLVDVGTSRVVFGGVLAPYLAGRIVERSEGPDRWTVPDHADVAGAVGCACARVSLETSVHIDSQRGVLTVSSVGPETVAEVEKGRTFTDDEIEEIAIGKAREAAEDAGGPPAAPCEVLATNRFNVVSNGRIVGEIVDVRSRVVPGFDTVSRGTP